MRNWFLIIFTFLTSYTFAQPEKVETEIVNGKKYYVHHVQSGNTLYGIHKLYNVSVEEIVKSNPGTEKGLIEGQKVLIPVPLETISHEVANKETLFAISKKYNVTVDAIIQANPGVENGLKTGQKLIIPGVERTITQGSVVTPVIKDPVIGIPSDTLKKPEPSIKISFSDTIILHKVLDKETLYSISKRFMVPVEDLQKLNGLKNTKIKPGDVIKIPVKKEKIETVQIRQVVPVERKKIDSTLLFPKQSTYKIAILLPFYLDKTENGSDHIQTLATEFYMGAKLAIDSLERLGLDAKVYVFDAKNDTLALKKILLKPEFSGMDLIFGPLFPENVDIVAKWCAENNARMVCPVACNASVIKENPRVYCAVPSDATLLSGLADYTLKNNSRDHIILIKSTSEKDKAMYESYRSTFLNAPYTGTRPKMIEATLENYTSFMKKGVKIVLVFPTNDKTLAMKFINSLNKIADKYNDYITIYGTKEWVGFEDIKSHYKNKYHFHYSGPVDLNYKYPQTERLHRKYRSSYNSDMTKMSVQGFDVIFYFCSSLLMDRTNSDMVMNHFVMTQKGLTNGYENSNCYILKQEEFELINVMP